MRALDSPLLHPRGDYAPVAKGQRINFLVCVCECVRWWPGLVAGHGYASVAGEFLSVSVCVVGLFWWTLMVVCVWFQCANVSVTQTPWPCLQVPVCAIVI